MTQSTHIRVATLVAAGFIATTTCGFAHADTTTSGNGSIGGGNQIGLDLDAPLNVCGNAVAVLGVAGADCVDGDASVTGSSSTKDSSTKAPHPGYEGYAPEEGEKPGEVPEDKEEDKHEEQTPEEVPGEVPGENPGQEVPEQEAPEGDEHEEQAEGEEPAAEQPPADSSGPSESASPTAPPADESSLAVTGTDQGALAGLLAAAVLAVAAGVGLLLFGKRRRALA